MTPADDGSAVHYSALQRGTSVISSDGEEVGKVDQVLDYSGYQIEELSER